MANLNHQCALILGTLICSAMLCSAEFEVSATTIVMAEGGNAGVLLVSTDGEQFSMVLPKGYRPQSHAESRSIALASESGASAITVRFSTNYAGILPKQQV